ncbi:MAG: signal peptidase II [bacterium]
MKGLGRYILLAAIAGGVVLLDQWTKAWVHAHMRLYETDPVIPGLLDLHYIRNTGSAFGFLSGSHSGFRIPFFIGISVLAIGIILYLFHKLEDSEWLVPSALSLVLGGAAGNLIDRIRLGEVIDFLHVHYRSFHWPAFNVADAAITAGVILLLIRTIGFDPRRPQENRPDRLEKEGFSEGAPKRS